MKIFRMICIVLILSLTLTGVCGALSASEIKTKVTGSKLMPRENILLNAYLVPLQNESIRAKMLQACKDAEIDILSHIYVSDNWVAEDHTYDKYKPLMAEVNSYGMKLMTRDFDVQNLVDKTDGQIREIAEKYKNLPGFAGFYVVDEPFNPNPYARVENILREVCPNALVNVNFLPRGCYTEGDYIRQLKDYGGLISKGGTLSLDVYTFTLNGGIDEYSLFKNYDDLRLASLATEQNSAVYVQSIGLNGGYRRPSGGDLRYNMMAALAYGVKEIKFFTWSTPPSDEGVYTDAIFDKDWEPTELYDEVCKINKKIHKLGTYLAACDALSVYHSRQKTANAYETVPEDFFAQVEGNAEVILSLFKERDGNDEYLMVVNKDFKASQTFTLSLALDSVQMINNETGTAEPLALTDGKVTFTLGAGDATLLKLPEGSHFTQEKEADKNLALGASVTATSSFGASGLYLSNLTDGVKDSLGARLVSSDNSDQSVTLDLLSVKNLNRIELYPSGTGTVCGQLFPTKYNVQLSENGTDWVTIANNDAPYDKAFVPVILFNETKARYIKLTVTDFTRLSNQADFGEIAAYLDDGSMPDKIETSYIEPSSSEAINVALGKPVVDYSSTTDNPAWNCEHSYLTDGDPTKAWASELFVNDTADSEEWIIVDLLGVYDIGRVELIPRDVWHGVNVFPSDYEIQVSPDGEEFKTVASVKGDNDPQTQDIRILRFDTVPARYVKLLATKLTKSGTDGAGYCIEINEMEVYCGKKAEPETTQPQTEPITEATTDKNTEPSVDNTTDFVTEPNTNKDNKAGIITAIVFTVAVLTVAAVLTFVFIAKKKRK